jgi:hypothetical protein
MVAEINRRDAQDRGRFDDGPPSRLVGRSGIHPLPALWSGRPRNPPATTVARDAAAFTRPPAPHKSRSSMSQFVQAKPTLTAAAAGFWGTAVAMVARSV